MGISNHYNLEFTEPSFKYRDEGNINDYDIVFSRDKVCKPPNISGSTLCFNCYINALSDKLVKTRKSKRNDFIDYQTSLREDKLTFLEELNDMFVDYETQFDEEDYNLTSDYKDIISDKIDSLKNDVTDNYASNPSRPFYEPAVIQLPEDFKLTSMNLKASGLDINQTAILFYMLRKKDAFLNYNDSDLAKFAHYLTGHSEQNLRTRKGFGAIQDIMDQYRQGESSFNLKSLKIFLEELIEDIDNEIKE